MILITGKTLMAAAECDRNVWLVCISGEREAVCSEVRLNYLDGNVSKPGHLLFQGQPKTVFFSSLDIF